MNTVYIDGKLVPQGNIVEYFSDDVKAKFDKRALQALIELVTSEVCENVERVVAIDSRDVMDGLQIRWDGLTEEDKEAINNDQLLANEMPNSDGACIVFPERWSTYLEPVGTIFMRLEGQCGLRKSFITTPDDAKYDNWYVDDVGRSLVCDVDLTFTLPWLSKRVRIPDFGRYVVKALDDRILWGAHTARLLAIHAKASYHDGMFDLMDHGFLEGYETRFIATYEKIKVIETIMKELDCCGDMAIGMIRLVTEEFDDDGKETCELLLNPNIKRSSILREA